jgi:hypothetical protein
MLSASSEKNSNKSNSNKNNSKDDDITNHIVSRRTAMATSALATATASTILLNSNNSNNVANALDLNPFSPADRKITNNYQYTPAKRATSYLVDSTIPPTLVPFKAQREAAILKGLGGGSGTAKTPFIAEKLTLNNMMNKGVFGTIDFVARLGGDDSSNKKKTYDATFVFLGLDYQNESGEDTQLAIDLISDIIKPRRGLDTALALSFAPISTQKALNEYLASSNSNSNAEDTIIETLINDGKVPKSIIVNQLPILRYAKSKQLKLIATSPEPIDVQTVRTQGLQNVDPERRAGYVADAQGFIDWTQDARNKLYTERSLLKDWTPLDDKETSPAGFFAEKILVHETIATRMANYVFSENKKNNALVINIASIPDLRFMGGPNGRIARICKVIKPDATVDDEAVTTILINPSAQETLSQSKFIRLEIGTAPANLAYQTKVSDYLWFSSMPKVNTIPRLMNG